MPNKSPAPTRTKSAAAAKKAAGKNVGGQPSSFTQAKADAICIKLADGRSLRSICREPESPHMTTVLKWLRDFPDFASQYARAKQDGIESMLEDCLEIADDGRNDWMETEYGQKVDREAIERSKLRVDVRKWFASKLVPKKYGDKIEQTVKGDAENPLVTRVVIVPPKNPAQVETRPIKRDGGED